MDLFGFITVLLIAVKLSLPFERHCSDPGMVQNQFCRARIPTIYYDEDKKKCDCFYYSGCGGNDNRFKNVAECMTSCDVIDDEQIDKNPCETLRQGLIHSFNTSSTCDLPLQPGICRAYLPQFYYNKNLEMCDCFVYTGCQGNDNRFKSLEACMAQCNVPSLKQKVTHRCKNNFSGTDLMKQLERKLSDEISPCEQPAIPGSGQDYIPSFYFDKKMGICDCFVYSGRNGNKNRFKSIYDCMGSCGVSSLKQEITMACKKHFEGTQMLVDLLNDQKLGHRANEVPGSGNSAPISTVHILLFIPLLFGMIYLLIL